MLKGIFPNVKGTTERNKIKRVKRIIFLKTNPRLLMFGSFHRRMAYFLAKAILETDLEW